MEMHAARHEFTGYWPVLFAYVTLLETFIRYSKMFPARDGEVFHKVRSFLMQVVCKLCGTGIPHYNPVRNPGGLGFPRNGTWTVDLEVESN